ncbi:MAG: AMP-binding protein [Muribaculaceae bacterium]|nr:AMP-binding protein [Muribaculaceae bacterium]
MRLLATTPETEEFLQQWYSDSEYIIAHTSGSTGKPKEIRLLKSDMIASADATNRFFSIGPDSRLVCPLSASYIAGKMMIVRAIRADATLEMLTPSNRLELHGDITLLPVVPSQIGSLVNLNGVNVENLIVGGAPLTADMEKKLISYPSNSYATYGMTETCSHVALRKVGEPMFEALPGVSFSIDEKQRLQLELPQFSFKRLSTNDIVELHTPTSFRWLGRYDNVVNSGGIKLFPEEIERELTPFVKGDFYLCGLPHPLWGEQLVMCVTPDTVVDRHAMEIVIPHYRLPKQTIVLPAFQYTSTGKLRRTLDEQQKL